MDREGNMRKKRKLVFGVVLWAKDESLKCESVTGLVGGEELTHRRPPEAANTETHHFISCNFQRLYTTSFLAVSF